MLRQEGSLGEIKSVVQHDCEVDVDLQRLLPLFLLRLPEMYTAER